VREARWFSSRSTRLFNGETQARRKKETLHFVFIPSDSCQHELSLNIPASIVLAQTLEIVGICETRSRLINHPRKCECIAISFKKKRATLVRICVYAYVSLRWAIKLILLICGAFIGVIGIIGAFSLPRVLSQWKDPGWPKYPNCSMLPENRVKVQLPRYWYVK